MAEMTTPIDFMHQLMYKLQYTYDTEPNKLNLALADLTNIDGLTQITDWTQLRDMIKADITANLSGGGTAKDFLKNYCNIDLDNEDCGALIGFDCSGGEILTNDNIIEETGELQTHPSSAVIGGCTIIFPTFSDSKYNYVMDGLYTWWIGLPFELVKKSFGLEFNNDSSVRTMPVGLYDDPPSGGLVTGAYVSTSFDTSTFKAVALELMVNMNDAAFGTIIIGDKSGNTTDGWFAALDRVLAHELTHAVMATNIRGFNAWFPLWFIEGGCAELVNGCDDSRTSSLLAAAVDTAIIDDGFSDNPTMAREYSVGFIAMRYLLKKYTDRRVHIYFPVKPKEPFEKVWEKMAHGIRSEYCISRDGDFNKIIDEFVDFVQRDDYNLVQPWTLCENVGSKTLRIPLEGHEKKTEDVVATYGSREIFIPDYFSGIHAFGISDTLSLSVTDKEEFVFYTIPCYSMNNGKIFAIGSSDYDLFVYNQPYSYNIDVINSYSDVFWSCTLFGYNNDLSSAIDKLIEMYNDYTGTDRPNINIGFTAYTFSFMNTYQLAKLVNTVKANNGKLVIYPLGYKYIPGEIIFSSSYEVDTIINLLDDFADQYPSLQSYVEVHWEWFNIIKDVNFEEEIDKGNLPYSPMASVGAKLIDFGEICSVPEHRMTGSDPYPPHCYHVWGRLSFTLGEPIFKISKKQSTDFPCFYLSTGVFKPSMWRHEGLDYPTIAVDNEDDEYIPFNIHILNDYRMRFDLQGIGTCKKVTGKKGDANLLNGIRQTAQYSYSANVISDPIPGIGCPLIVRSVENKEDYNTILCYFTKTDYSGTFTLIFYDENDEEKPPIFQSVAFGLGISEEESYKYPLYTAGGSNGLYPGYYSFSYMPGPYAPTPVVLRIYGNKFNFDMTKGDTLGSLLYPVVTEGCGISNFRVLQPSGLWKSAINFKQAFYDEGKETCGAYITKNNGHTIQDCLVYPTISDIINVDRYTLVQPVTVIKKHIDGDNESGFIMSINGVKCKPDRLRSMIIALDGHEYLIVPNGWYDRVLGVPIRKVSSSEILVDVIMELLQKMPKQTYVLCIDLG